MSVPDQNRSAGKTAQRSSTPPPDHLVLDGRRLPCYVKVAVYQAGQAAGLGIKTTDPASMATLFHDEVKAQLIREMLRKQVDEELAQQGVTYGIQEEEIRAAVSEFVERVVSGTGATATRKVAEGQSPEPGEDARLEYLLNPGGQPLRALGKADRVNASRKVNEVKQGDVLVVGHPPRPGQKGCNVRGEGVEPTRQPRDVSLETVAGANTSVAEGKVLAALEGVYREDARGQVQVVQEVAVEEVNAVTGNLPRAGVAATHFLVRKGVRNGFGIFTTEDVFVGRERETGALDRDTRIRARNLFVRGQVAGEQLPAEYLSGETEGLEEAERRRIAHQLERSRVEVEELFGAREVLGRNVSAGTILVQTHCYTSALDAEGDILVDGNLSGGVVSFGRRLQVLGHLGDAKGGATRIRVGAAPRAEQKKDRFKTDIQAKKAKLEALTEKLETHQEGMERFAKKSAYWAALLKGEKRAPQGPTESRILVQFFQAAKWKTRLEQEVADSKREVDDLEHLFQEMEEEESQDGSALMVVVGGTVYPGVHVELIHPLEAADLEKRACRRITGRAAEGRSYTLQEIKRELSQEVNDYVTPRQERVEERRQALDQMFKGREQRPHAPAIPNKRFQTELVFPEADAEGSGQNRGSEGWKLPMEGVVYVYARDPQKFYFKRIWKVKESLENVTISIEKGEDDCVVRCAPNKTPLTPWQQEAQILESLDAVQVLGQSARALLLG